MLKGYTAGPDVGPRNECWARCWDHPTLCGVGGEAGPGLEEILPRPVGSNDAKFNPGSPALG